MLPNLKVWSTVKIRGTRVPQKAIVPVGRPRPYSIIILNMRFIPKALKSHRLHIYLSEIYELKIQSPLPLPLLGRWLANKLTLLLRGCRNWLTPSLYWHPVNTKHLYDLPTLYKCYTNVLCLLGRRTSLKHCTFIQCWFNVGPASQTLA